MTVTKTACPYCLQEAVLATGDEVYPHRDDLSSRRFWVCWPCDARVGCHPGSAKPLGTLANAELRRMRAMVHSAFDPLWKDGTFVSRSHAYAWLASALDIAKSECHIGMFSIGRCSDAMHHILGKRSWA